MDNARFRRNRYLYYDYATLFVLYNVLISFNCMVQLVVIMIIKKKISSHIHNVANEPQDNTFSSALINAATR